MIVPILGVLLYLLVILASPLLLLQYVERKRFEDAFDISRAAKVIINRPGQYLTFIFKLIVVAVIYILASVFIITIPFTLPGFAYSSTYMCAMMYKELALKK